MTQKFLSYIDGILSEIEAEGLTKRERLITSPQAGCVSVQRGGKKREVINFCANNYLGLASHPRLIEAATRAMSDHGYGMASVRFICGTQDLHRDLEAELARFLGHDDAILFAACFDANGGLFEPLLTDEDAVVSDSLNHASIIDGIRLCRARRYRYNNCDMNDLEAKLKEARAADARFVMIATGGVFSMDGTLANLPDITSLAKKYDAIVMVDDCHATGIIGSKGAGTPAHHGVKVDIVTGTLGKALGGALGGYIAGAQPVIDLLRQRARPYLFSNSLPPAVVAASIEALRLVEEGEELRKRLFDSTSYWRAGLSNLGFKLLPGKHPIVPVMLEDSRLSQQISHQLYQRGVYVIGFVYPVVPLGQARVRTQMNAALTREDLDTALAAFSEVGQQLGVIT